LKTNTLYNDVRRARRSGLRAAAAGLLAAVALTGTAHAADTWTIDPAHSSVGFSVRHFVAKVNGQFGTYEGTIQLDPQALDKTKVNATIQVASIDTNEPKRDGHLKSADFFDAETYPTITFVSTAVKPEDETTGTLTGDLTIRGVTKSVDLDYEILGFGPDAWGNERAGLEAKGKINRKDFGVNWNKVLDNGGVMLGEDVALTINVEAVKQKPEEAQNN